MDSQAPVLSRRLSGSDAAFLYLERKEIPLNIACVALFDGPIPFREFVANIDSKLDLIPRYRQVAVPPPFNLGYPTWEYDSKFDIRRHIFPVRLDAPGGEAELEALAGRLLSQVLDRSKPLWEIHIVDGLKDGRGALIARIHHALADGVAGAALLKIMLDPTPEGSHAIRRPGPRGAPKGAPRGPAPRAAEHTLAEQLGGAIQSALENAVAAEAGLLSLADALLGDRGKSALDDLAALLPDWLHPPERFPFNKPCSGDRKFCWAEADFNQVQAIRAALGGKVNDCILSVVVRAIARYIRLHGEKVEGRFLRVVCPVNLRGGEQGESLGNRITFLPVVLPLDVDDPVEMLHAVASRMKIMKSVHAAELVSIFASCLGTTPAPVQELFWRGIPLVPLPLPLLNLICTNVPGSPSALYTAGRRMVASYPHVPTGYELGVGVAAQSYDGKLFFGLTADAHVAPDVARLRDYIRVSFKELAKAAGVGRAPRAARPVNQRKAAGRGETETAAPLRPRPAKHKKPAVASEEQAPGAVGRSEVAATVLRRVRKGPPVAPLAARPSGEMPEAGTTAAATQLAREAGQSGEPVEASTAAAAILRRDRKGRLVAPAAVEPSEKPEEASAEAAATSPREGQPQAVAVGPSGQLLKASAATAAVLRRARKGRPVAPVAVEPGEKPEEASTEAAATSPRGGQPQAVAVEPSGALLEAITATAAVLRWDRKRQPVAPVAVEPSEKPVEANTAAAATSQRARMGQTVASEEPVEASTVAKATSRRTSKGPLEASAGPVQSTKLTATLPRTGEGQPGGKPAAEEHAALIAMAHQAGPRPARRRKPASAAVERNGKTAEAALLTIVPLAADALPGGTVRGAAEPGDDAASVTTPPTMGSAPPVNQQAAPADKPEPAR